MHVATLKNDFGVTSSIERRCVCWFASKTHAAACMPETQWCLAIVRAIDRYLGKKKSA